MMVQCPRCSNVRKYVRGHGKQMRCNVCTRSLTPRHEVIQ